MSLGEALDLRELAQSLRGYELGREIAKEHFPEPRKVPLRVLRTGMQLVSVCFMYGILEDWLKLWDTKHEILVNLDYGDSAGDRKVVQTLIARRFNYAG